MSDLFLVQDVVYNFLKDYIKNKVDFEVDVLKSKVAEQEKPLIVFSENQNGLFSTTTNYEHNIRMLSYDIDIYCKGVQFEQIAKTLSSLVVNVMERHFKMNGGIVGVLPRYKGEPNTIQVNLKYTTKYDPIYRRNF